MPFRRLLNPGKVFFWMSGKSRKRSISRRPTDADARPQPGTSGGGLLAQATPTASSGAAPRYVALFWTAGAVAVLAILYIGLSLFSPTILPDWLRINNGPAPAPTISANSTTTPAPVNSANRISFIRSSQNGTKRVLFVVNTDGTNQQQVTPDNVYVEGSANWSPDGTRLIVQATVSGVSTIVLVTVGADNKLATDSIQLTADVKADSVLPAWSPDGTMIAFQSKRNGDYQVFVMSADGTNKKLLSDGKGYAGQPAWSPDGKSVVYIEGADSNAGSVRELYTVPVAGGAPKQLTTLNTNVGHPVWSPNGDLITFLQTLDQYDERILAIKPDGTGERTLVKGGLNSSQSFAPDGTALTYFKVDPSSGENIYVVSVADSKETSITKGGSGNYLSTWSPDGKQLAWASKVSDSANYKIVVANADGSNVHTVSQGDGDDYQPSWGFIK